MPGVRAQARDDGRDEMAETVSLMRQYPFSPEDYALATAHLTPEEDLAYRRLLDLYYTSEKPIPPDIGWIGRRLRLPENAVSAVLGEFFRLDEGGWHNARCDMELSRYHAARERNRANGRLGGRPGIKKLKENVEKKPTGNPLGFQWVPIENPLGFFEGSQAKRENCENPINSTPVHMKGEVDHHQSYKNNPPVFDLERPENPVGFQPNGAKFQPNGAKTEVLSLITNTLTLKIKKSKKDQEQEQEQEKIKSKDKKEIPTPSPLPFSSGEVIPEGVDGRAWSDFLAHRKEIREPLTALAAKKAANVLRVLTPEQQREAVDTSIVSRWTGVFPPKGSAAPKTGHMSPAEFQDRVRRGDYQ